MTGDHLSARQQSRPHYGQHSLSNLTGLAYASSGIVPADSTIYLPRCGKVGSPLVDKEVRLATSTPVKADGLILECVYRTTVTGFNFFGGVWGRTISRVGGYYGYTVGIDLWPINGSISDTQGKAQIAVFDTGSTWVTSRTVHSARVINDGLPHHLALRYDPHPGTTVRLYVDGIHAETASVSGAMSDLQANLTVASAEAFFTHCDGMVSHLYSAPATSSLSDDRGEIAARAQMVNGANDNYVLPDNGQVMAWSSARLAWLPVRGYATLDGTWKIARPGGG